MTSDAEHPTPHGSEDERTPPRRDLDAATLLPILYEELRRLAEARLRRTPPGLTLQPTALVHEAWIKLVGDRDPGWSHRGHFLAAAAQAMREILVDHARRRSALKRGGGRLRVEADVDGIAIEVPVDEVLALDEALRQLERAAPRPARVVELRWFAGLSNAEAAQVLEISEPTVERDWRFARSWLAKAIAGETASDGSSGGNSGGSSGGNSGNTSGESVGRSDGEGAAGR